MFNKMKKIFLVVISMFCLCTYVNAETRSVDSDGVEKSVSKEKVTLHLFRNSGCGYCAAEMTYLDSIYSEYKDKLNIVVYNISEAENVDLLEAVASELKTEFTGVPFNIIGKQYIEGYAEVLNSELTGMFDSVYESQEEDIVSKVLEEKKFSTKTTTLFEAMDEEGLEHSSGNGEKDSSVAVIVVFGAIIIGFGALVYFSRKD